MLKIFFCGYMVEFLGFIPFIHGVGIPHFFKGINMINLILFDPFDVFLNVQNFLIHQSYCKIIICCSFNYYRNFFGKARDYTKFTYRTPICVNYFKPNNCGWETIPRRCLPAFCAATFLGKFFAYGRPSVTLRLLLSTLCSALSARAPPFSGLNSKVINATIKNSKASKIYHVF